MLVTVNDVIVSMALQTDLEGPLTPAITSAIAKATTRLQTELDTLLFKYTNVETFHLDSDHFNGVVLGGRLRIRLRNAYVTGTPTLSFCEEKWNGTFEVIPTTDYEIQADSGIINLDSLYAEAYVQVTYASGFQNKTDCPDILKQAILSYVPMFLTQTQGTDEEPKAKGKVSGDLAQGIVQRLNRTLGFCYRPISHVATVV